MLVLVANPSADVYGSDLQLAESVSAIVGGGHRVVVVTPDDGPLVPVLGGGGGSVELLDYPVVRRRNLSFLGLVELVVSLATAIPRMFRCIRRLRPDVIYVNTMTIPWWALVARLARVPVVTHVHEAEADDPRLIRWMLNVPLILSNMVIVNGMTALEAMLDVIPSLERRTVVIHNGVEGPAGFIGTNDQRPDTRWTVAVIGRLSPRKATDVAIRAVAKLRSSGSDVRVEIAGTAFEGYEWYVDELEALAKSADLDGAVTFLGYVNPPWPVLARADVLVAPSTRESLGNVVIEAQLAERPVIATATSGHFESVEDGRTGLLVPVGDVDALAAAIQRLRDDPDLAARLASAGRISAQEKFDPDRYRSAIVDVVELMAERAPS